MLIVIRQFVQAMKDYRKHSSSDKKIENFPPIIGPLRQLTIASSSLMLIRFNNTLNNIGFTTLVDDLTIYRSKNFGAPEILAMARRRGDPPMNTGVKMLQLLSYGSPKLRYILNQLRTYVLPENTSGVKRKLLITEDIPLVAFFYECAIRITYIDVEVLHAGLTNAEREILVKRFKNKDDSLTVLIIMYQVSAQGVNLDSCCSRVIVCTPAINAPSEIQAWSRLIRVSFSVVTVETSYRYEGLTYFQLRSHSYMLSR